MANSSRGSLLWRRVAPAALLLAASLLAVSCNSPDEGKDEKVTTLGTVEVTAKLVEIRGEPKPDPMYNYAYVMKYRVLEVHRGKVDRDDIYVAHYNPYKPRGKAADFAHGNVGGRAKKIRAGDIHRMALDVPVEEFYMGGVINKYFGEDTGPIYWAAWTNLVIR